MNDDPRHHIVVLSGRLSSPNHSMRRLLKQAAGLTSKKKWASEREMQGLTDEISSENERVLPKQLTRLKLLDRAEIMARAWRGQTSAELAAMFKVTPRTINRIIRESRR